MLQAPDEQDLVAECEAFEALTNDRAMVRLGRIRAECRCWLLALDGEWVTGMARRMGKGRFLTIEVQDQRAHAPGTSGSPILTDHGLAIGVVSCSGTMDTFDPILADVLPAWFIRMWRAHRRPA